MDCLRLCTREAARLCIADLIPLRDATSEKLSLFGDDFCRFSICPKTVVPLKARFSSGTLVNRTTPLVAATPSESARKACIKAALRLFVVGRTCEGKALIVRQ